MKFKKLYSFISLVFLFVFFFSYTPVQTRTVTAPEQASVDPETTEKQAPEEAEEDDDFLSDENEEDEGDELLEEEGGEDFFDEEEESSVETTADKEPETEEKEPEVVVEDKDEPETPQPEDPKPEVKKEEPSEEIQEEPAEEEDMFGENEEEDLLESTDEDEESMFGEEEAEEKPAEKVVEPEKEEDLFAGDTEEKDDLEEDAEEEGSMFDEDTEEEEEEEGENIEAEEDEEEADEEEEEEEEAGESDPLIITLPYIGEIKIDIGGMIDKAFAEVDKAIDKATTVVGEGAQVASDVVGDGAEAVSAEAEKIADSRIIEFGPLILKNIIATKTAEGETKVEAAATFLKTKAKLFMEQGDATAATFNVELSEKLIIPLTPWKSVTFESFKLHLTEEGKKLETQTSLDSKNPKALAKFVVNLDPEDLYSELSIEEFNPTELFGIPQDSPVAKMFMKNTKIKIQNPFDGPMLDVTGFLDLSKVDLGLQLKQHLKTTAFYNSEKGLLLSAEMSNIDIPPGIGKLKSAKFIIKREPDFTSQAPVIQDAATSLAQGATPIKKPKPKGLQILIEGSSVINLPMDLGKLETKTTAKFAKNLAGKYALSFKSYLGKPIKIQNLEITNTNVEFSTDGSFKFVGIADFEGNPITAKLISKRVKGKQITEFSGEFPKDKTLKPFEKVDIPGLKDIGLKDVIIALQKDKTFSVRGFADILGFKSNVLMNKVEKGISLIATPPKNWKISDMVKEAKGTVVDDLDITDVKILASSAAYVDKKLGIKVNKGFTIAAKIPLEALGEMEELFKDNPDMAKEFILQGTIGTSLKQLTLSLQIPVTVNIKDVVEIQGITAKIGGVPPGFSFATKVIVTLPPKKEKLSFTSIMSLNAAANLAIAGSMKGEWKNPFGIKGLTVEDLGLEVGVNVVTLVPTIIGFTGKTYIGEKGLEVASKITWPNVTQFALVCKMLGEDTELTLKDMATIPQKYGMYIPVKTLPHIGIYDLNVYIVPAPLMIGGIEYQPGFNVQGKIEIQDQEAEVFATIGDNGIILYGYMPEINLGNVLKITGMGKDRKRGTKDDGPIIDARITPDEQYFYMDGKTQLLKNFAESDVKMSWDKDGAHFTTKTSVLDAITVSLEGHTIEENKKIVDFRVSGFIENDLTVMVKKEVIKAAGEMHKGVMGGLRNAEREVEKAQRDVDKLTNELGNIKEKIHKLQAKVDAERASRQRRYNRDKNNLDKAKAKLKPLKNNLDKAQSKVNKLGSDIKDRQANIKKENSWYNKLGKWKKIKYAVGHRAKVSKWNIEVASLWTAYQTSNSALAIAKGTTYKTAMLGVNIAEEAVKASYVASSNIDGMDEAVIIAKLQVDRAALKVVRDTSNSIVELRRGIVNELQKGAEHANAEFKKFINKLLGAFVVRKTTMEFDLKALAEKGKMPKVSIDMVVGGKPLKLKDIQFNWQNIEKSAEQIAKKVLAKVKAIG
jgi:hypothetical protein